MPQQRNLCRIELSRRQSCPCPCGKDDDDDDDDDGDVDEDDDDDDLVQLSRIINAVPKQFKS